MQSRIGPLSFFYQLHVYLGAHQNMEKKETGGSIYLFIQKAGNKEMRPTFYGRECDDNENNHSQH